MTDTPSTQTSSALAGATPTRPAVVTVPGSGRGSYVIGLTITAIAGFAILTLLTSVAADNIRWIAPLALVVAGVIALVRRR